MIIPMYIPITMKQYEQLRRLDADDASDLAMEWMEEETTGEVVDIDKQAEELAGALTDPVAVEAVNGAVLLCDDPALLVADAEKVAAMAAAMAESSVDDDLEDALDTLAEFYATAAENDHAVAVLYN